MNLAAAIVTQNKATQKSLAEINKNISVLVTMQKNEEQKDSLRDRRAAQAAKRAEADRKREERKSAIVGSGDKKDKKVDSGAIIKALGLAAAGTAIVAYFKSEKFRKFVNEKIFAPIGDFFKTKLGEIGESIKQFALDLPKKLFGKKGLFGEENRQKLMDALFGTKGLFGKENRDALHKFLFASDGIFGKKNRDQVYEALLGDKGIFSPKNVSDAYKSFKSFFVDDADWKKSVREGTYKFFVEDAEWKQNITKGFEIVVEDFKNLMGDLGNALKNWVINNVPGVKPIVDTYNNVSTTIQSGIDSTKNTFGFAADSEQTREAQNNLNSSRQEAVLRGMNPLMTDSERNVLQMQTDEKEKILEFNRELDQARFDLEKVENRLDTKKYKRQNVKNRDLEKAEELREQIELLEKKIAIYSQNPIGLQTGGSVRKVPGTGSGDKVPAMLKPGSFVLNREASKFLYRQEGGAVPAMLEPGELVFPKTTSSLENLNEKVPRFQKKALTPRKGDGAPSEQMNTALALESQGVQFRQKGGKIYLHWVASGYNYKDTNHYHKIVQGDGSIFDANPISNYRTPKGHTWGRNGSGVGISAAAMAGGVPQGPWPTPPKPEQIIGMGKAIAQVAKEWGWSPSQINASNVMTHSEAAYKDGYGLGSGDPQTKWDFDRVSLSDPPKSGGNKLRAAAKKAMGMSPGGTGSASEVSTGDFSGGGGDPSKTGNGIPGGGTGVEAILKACESNIGLSKGIPEQCANTTRAVLKAAGHPAAGKTTTKGDLEIDGVPDQYRAPSYASSFGGTDMGKVTDSYNSTKPGDIILWKGTYGVDKWGADAITHVGIKGKGSSVYHHGKTAGWRKTGPSQLDKFAYGVTLNGTGGSDGLSGTQNGTSSGGFDIGGLALGAAGLFASGAFGDYGPIMAALGLGSMLDSSGLMPALGEIFGGMSGALEGAGDMFKGLFGGGDAPSVETDEKPSSGSPISASGPGGGDVASITKSMGFDQKAWDIFANTIGAKESGNRYDPVPVGKGGGSGGMYDGRWQLGGAAKTDAARILGERDPGHGQSGSAARKAFIADKKKQDRFFAAYTKANYGYMMSDPKFKALDNVGKWSILGYAHNLGHSKAKEFLDTGVSGADGFGTKSVTYTKALKKNLTAAGYQTGGLVSTMLEPGETVGDVEAFNNAIPRFGGGSNHMMGTITPTSQNFYEKTLEMSDSNNPIVVMMGGGQSSKGASGNSMASHPSNPAPSLSNGPSMASLSDIINRVSWSSVF